MTLITAVIIILSSGALTTSALDKHVRADDPSIVLLEAETLPEPPLSKTGKAYLTLNNQGFDVLDDAPIAESWVIQTLITFARTSKGPILDVGGAYGGITRLLLKQGATVYYNDLEGKHLLFGLKKVSPEMRTNLFLNIQSFPNEMNFAPGSLSGVVLHRILHFMGPETAEEGINKAAEWLEPGGKIFIVVLAPQHIAYRHKFLNLYEARWRSGDKWPGSEIEASEALPEQAYCLPKFLHIMDERPLRFTLEKYGFVVEKADFISMKRFGIEGNRDGMESFGIIGMKKAVNP
jgi:SAM-dependent methyltransferase